MTDEEKREIVVKAPSKPIVSPEEKEHRSTEKALEAERFGVLELPKKFSRHFGGAAIVAGLVLIGLFFYAVVSGQNEGFLLSGSISLFSLLIWGFVGLVNVFIGFLFMGRD